MEFNRLTHVGLRKFVAPLILTVSLKSRYSASGMLDTY